MSENREKGGVPFSGSMEPQASMPLDARSITKTKASLLLSATWTANDGNLYIYKGLQVTVYADSNVNNNGIYILENDDYTDINNWLFLKTDKNIDKQITAGQTISALKPISAGVDNRAIYADSAEFATNCIGISVSAAVEDGLLEYVSNGETIEDDSWDWDITKPIFINGTELSQIAPISGYYQQVAECVTNKKININIKQKIKLM